MELIFSVALLGFAVIIATVIYLASRMPVTPWWASDTGVSNFWCVLIVGLVAFGIGFAVQFAVYWEERSIGLREIVILGVVVAGYSLLWSAIGVRKRLARYAQARSRFGEKGKPLIEGTPVGPAPATPPRNRVPPKAA